MVFSREPSLSAPGHFNQLWKPSLDGGINIPQSLSLRPPRDGESDGRAADSVSQNIPQVLCEEGSQAPRLILSH